MSLHDDFFDEALRQGIIRTMEGTPIPAAYRVQVAELACHAAQTALDALETIVFNEPDPRVQISAMSVALSLIQSRAADMLNATISVANATGGKVEHHSVRVRK